MKNILIGFLLIVAVSQEQEADKQKEIVNYNKESYWNRGGWYNCKMAKYRCRGDGDIVSILISMTQ